MPYQLAVLGDLRTQFWRVFSAICPSKGQETHSFHARWVNLAASALIIQRDVVITNFLQHF